MSTYSNAEGNKFDLSVKKVKGKPKGHHFEQILKKISAQLKLNDISHSVPQKRYLKFFLP